MARARARRCAPSAASSRQRAARSFIRALPSRGGDRMNWSVKDWSWCPEGSASASSLSRKTGDGRLCRARRRGHPRRYGKRLRTVSRAWRNGTSRPPARCQAANSRWSRWGVRSIARPHWYVPTGLNHRCGLAPHVGEGVPKSFRHRLRTGVTILLIEQNARLALEYSKRGYVMEMGELILSGPASTLLNDPRFARRIWANSKPAKRATPRLRGVRSTSSAL